MIERWIGSSRYASRSEVIRAALRALEREEEERTGRPAAFAAEIARQARQNLDVTLGDDQVARLGKKLGFANESGDVWSSTGRVGQAEVAAVASNFERLDDSDIAAFHGCIAVVIGHQYRRGSGVSDS